MKLFITALLTLTIISLSAQEGFVPKVYELTKAPKQKIQNHKPQIPNSNKSPGDTIFYEDFDSVRWGATCSSNYEPVPENAPDGYSLVDNTGNNFHWRWSDRGPRGAYSGGCAFPATDPLYSTSGDNGFLLFEADWYNSTDDCTLADPYIHQDAYVQFSSIDFTDVEYVFFRFEQMSRFCCGYSETENAFFEISNDYGNTWIAYDVSPTDINEASNNPDIMEFNLCEVAGNEPDVRFRFHLVGLSHYHWEIDDLLFYEAWEYDVKLNDYWNDYMMQTFPSDYYNYNPSLDFYGGFYSQPWFVMHPYVGFRGAIENFGSETMTNITYHVDIYRNGSLMVNHTSNPVVLQSGEKDTLEIDFSNTPDGDFYEVLNDTAWFTNIKGNYEVVMYPSSDEQEENTQNDTIKREFQIVDSVISYSRLDSTFLIRKIRASDFVWSYYMWAGLGFEINLPHPACNDTTTETPFYHFSSISVFVADQEPEGIELIESGEARFKGRIFKYNPENFWWDEILESPYYTVTIDDVRNWVTIPLSPGNEFKIYEEADLRVILEFNGRYVTDREHNIDIGEDYGRKTPGQYSCLICVDGGEWSPLKHTPAIALNVYFSGNYPYVGASRIDAQKLKSKIYPNPNTGTFTIEVEEESTATISNAIGTILDVFDVKEQQTVTVDYQTGVYFVQLKSNNRQVVHRLIIE